DRGPDGNGTVRVGLRSGPTRHNHPVFGRTGPEFSVPVSGPLCSLLHGIHSDNKQTTRNSSDRNGLEKEDNQENNKKVNDLVEKNCYLMTESPDIPPINFSQGSSNNDDHSLATKIDDPSENRAVTRSGRHTRRGKGRGK
nr:hypothetical protein [Tanacetum cinerariifolium]